VKDKVPSPCGGVRAAQLNRLGTEFKRRKNPMSNNTSSRWPNKTKLTKLIVGVLLFALLMAIRVEIIDVWARAIVAACAFGMLGWVLVHAWRK
jgi:hypothetical protein